LRTSGYLCSSSGFCTRKIPGNGSREKHLVIEGPLDRVLQENQFCVAGMPLDQQHITLVYLCGGQQPGKWVHYMALDSTLQMARSIPAVGTLLQKELPRFGRYTKQEGWRR
jgi:hypothetical protein